MRFLNIILMMILSGLPNAAQSGVANGSIRGVTSDATGSVVNNASVSARNVATGFIREATTQEGGRFELPLLPIGVYEVQVKTPGFANYLQTGVAVTLDHASDLEIRLTVAGTQEVITVESDASILTTNTFSIGGGLNEKAMENMPITSRNTFNLALFAPGFNGRRDDEFGNPTFAFGGMQRRAFLMDGIDNTQRGGPGRLGIFSPETLKERYRFH